MSTEKNAQPKIVHYVLFRNLTEDYSLGGSLSDALEERSKEVREEPRYIGVFAEKRNVAEHQKITLIIKQTPQVNDFSAFLCMGRCRSLGSLKLFL